MTESFTAFGDRRNSCTWTERPTTGQLSRINSVSRRGYTWHTALGSMGLNDMNGRIQDAITGRFLSADPYVPKPLNTQAFNRYSYVYNNPLSYTDPSGFAPDEPANGEPNDKHNDDASEPRFKFYIGIGGYGHDPLARFRDWFPTPHVPPAAVIDYVLGGAIARVDSVNDSLSASDYVSLLNRGYYERMVGVDIGQGRTLMVPVKFDVLSDPTAAAGFEKAQTALNIVLVAGLAAVPGPEDVAFAGLVAARGITVIGRFNKATGNIDGIRAGEHSLLKHLPNQGGPKVNWHQNAGVLRQEMNKGLPIRDAAVNPRTGELVDYPGSFLNAERNLLRDRGWTYDPATTLWSPP